MRLIDLDEIEYFTLVDKDGIPRYKIEIGDGLPIVKAIPSEWIKKWCNEEHNRKSLEERLLKRYGVITMLEDWVKENEIDRS